jgi:tRNA modification GTPase
VKHYISELEKLLASSDNGRMVKEGIRTVIIGKPNAGKSSLMNVLLGENRAIVTEIAGTTRDTLEESMTIHGIPLHIIDTAGIRQTEDIVEKIGVDKAIHFAEDADLIIYVVDSSTHLDKNDEDIMSLIKDKKVIVLMNKSDLQTITGKEEILKYIQAPVIEISAKEETGLESFEKTLKEMFFAGNISYNDQLYITNIRHKTAITSALGSLRMVQKSIEDGMPEDFFSIDLMAAYEQLGTIIGEAVEEDLVNTIFSDFCMGK